MRKEKNVYEELARMLCEEFQRKQSASLLANLKGQSFFSWDCHHVMY